MVFQAELRGRVSGRIVLLRDGDENKRIGSHDERQPL